MEISTQRKEKYRWLTKFKKRIDEEENLAVATKIICGTGYSLGFIFDDVCGRRSRPKVG